MSNFRQTLLGIDCTSCVNFTSYQDEFEDELEPHEFGRCSKKIAEMVGEEMICDLHESDKK